MAAQRAPEPAPSFLIAPKPAPVSKKRRGHPDLIMCLDRGGVSAKPVQRGAQVVVISPEDGENRSWLGTPECLFTFEGIIQEVRGVRGADGVLFSARQQSLN